MPWTPPRSWSPGETPTAALFNANIRDNLTYLDQKTSIRVYRSTSQSHATSGAYAAVSFDSVRFQTGVGAGWLVGSPTRVTITDPGRYLVSGLLEYTSNATGVRGGKLQSNGGTLLSAFFLAAVSGYATQVPLSAVCQLAAGDYVEMFGFQSSGAALNLTSGSPYTPELALIRLASA